MAVAVGAAGIPRHAMPMHHILLERVVGREIEAAAEMPRRHAGRHQEEPQVHVRGGHIGIARMDDGGEGDGLKRPPGQLRVAFRGRGRQGVPDAMGEEHRGLFDGASVLKDARARDAAAGALKVFARETP